VNQRGASSVDQPATSSANQHSAFNQHVASSINQPAASSVNQLAAPSVNQYSPSSIHQLATSSVNQYCNSALNQLTALSVNQLAASSDDQYSASTLNQLTEFSDNQHGPTLSIDQAFILDHQGTPFPIEHTTTFINQHDNLADNPHVMHSHSQFSGPRYQPTFIDQIYFNGINLRWCLLASTQRTDPYILPNGDWSTKQLSDVTYHTIVPIWGEFVHRIAALNVDRAWHMVSCHRIGNVTLRDMDKPVVVLVHVFPAILQGSAATLAENIVTEYITLLREQYFDFWAFIQHIITVDIVSMPIGD
jgi:hypothetical protein